MEPITDLKSLLVKRATLVYYGELESGRFLQQTKHRISSLHLKRLINDSLDRSALHIESLALLLDEMGEVAPSGVNDAVVSLINEFQFVLHMCGEAEVCDAAIIGSTQNIIHYFISGYGTCAAYSKALKLDEVKVLFESIVADEKLYDRRLSILAEGNINEKSKSSLIL